MDLLSKRSLTSEAPGGSLAAQARELNLTEQLEIRLERHKQEAAKLEEALAALRQNPELERMFNLLQRL